jgi:hypothetical protein
VRAHRKNYVRLKENKADKHLRDIKLPRGSICCEIKTIIWELHVEHERRLKGIVEIDTHVANSRPIRACFDYINVYIYSLLLIKLLWFLLIVVLLTNTPMILDAWL